MKALQTRRLILRPWRLADAGDMLVWTSDRGVTAPADWPEVRSAEDCRRLIALRLLPHGDSLALCPVEGGSVIGGVRLKRIDEHTRELGYILSREYWGRGLMGEAVNALLGQAFSDGRLQTVYARCRPENERSAALLIRAGFARLPEYAAQDAVYIMRRAEYGSECHKSDPE